MGFFSPDEPVAGPSQAALQQKAAATAAKQAPLLKKKQAKAAVVQSGYDVAKAGQQGVSALEQAAATKKAAASKAMQGYQQAYGTFQGGIEGGRQAIRGQAAEGLAAGQAQSGGYGTAGGYGAALQAGRQAGSQLGGYEADTAAKQAMMQQQLADLGYGYAGDEFATAQTLGAAKQKAAADLLAAQQQEYQAPTDVEESQAAVASEVNRVKQYVTDTFKGTFNDDEGAAAQWVMEQSRLAEDPAVEAALVQLAQQISSGQYDF